MTEAPEDPSSMALYCEQALDWINYEMSKDKADWNLAPLVIQIGQVAAFLKMLRSLDEALENIELALSLIEEHDLGPHQVIVQSLRWADILRFRGEFEQAEEIFLSIIEICQSEKEVLYYLDVAYQHMGKLCFDLGDYKEALNNFDRAMELRKLKKDPNLIASTEMAIEITLQKILEG